MTSEYEIRKLMCDIGQRVYNRQMVAANDGNFSVKIGPNEILCTPTGVSKGFMTPSMICKVDGEGNVISTDGKHKPSSEIKMHLRIYKERPDVNSVVHAHPIYATAHAIAGIPLDRNIMPEAIIFLGDVPIAKYGMPSTPEIPEAVAEYLQTHDAVLLENHGALSWGADLMSAYFKMEGLEFYAELSYRAQMLGGAKELPDNEVLRLYQLRKDMNLPGKHPGAQMLDQKSGNENQVSGSNVDALVAEITKRVLQELK